MIWEIIFALSFVVSKSSAYEKGCPPPEDIFPCTCTSSPINILSCSNIGDTDTLWNVFIQSSEYSYNKVQIENTVVPYLPGDMFQGVKVKEIRLLNSTFIQLFDKIPENLKMLDILRIMNTQFLRGFSWEYLRNFPNLRTLGIYDNEIPVLDEKFNKSVTTNLQELTLLKTKTSRIKPGVLAEYKKLNLIGINDCKLSELSRNMLPTPFNGRELYFNFNQLKNIPVDLFNDMPNLQTVGLIGNRIETIPPSSSLKKVDNLLLERNPIECDCRIYWLVKYMPEFVTGECRNPVQYRGLLLKDLDYYMFNCPSDEE